MIYQMHPIETIDGIGSVLGKALRKQGISTTEDLLQFSEGLILSKANNITKFPIASIPNFVKAASLLQVNGIDKDIADSLAKLDIRTLSHLSSMSVETIQKKLDEAKKSGWMKNDVTSQDIVDWQLDSVRIDMGGVFTGQITERANTKKGIKDVQIEISDFCATTNEDGRFWIPGLKAGKQKAIISKTGYLTKRKTLTISVNQTILYGFSLKKGTDTKMSIDESKGERIYAIEYGDKFHFEEVAKHDLPDGAALIFIRRYKDGGIKLQAIDRSREGRQIIVRQIQYPSGSIPDDAPIGRVFIKEDEKLIDTKSASSEYVKRRFLREDPIGKVLSGNYQ